jgi:hypothetical protein
MPTYNNNDQGRAVPFGEGTEIAIGQQPTSGAEQPDPSFEQGQEEVVQEQKKDGQRKDRAKQRIKQLATEKNAYKDEAANYKRMYEETVQRMQAESKSTNANLKTTLEAQYNQVLQQMGDAIRSGEADTVVKCQDAMMNIKIQLDKLNSAPVQAESPRQTVREEPVPQTPELARLWIEDHPAFHTDELFRNSALTVNNQLLREGYDAETEDFYEALSARLSKRFPEVFGTQEENMVQYKGDENDTDDSAPIVKPAARPQVRTQEQVVSGSARPSANTIRSSKSSNSQVAFSKQDSDIMNAWGLNPERIADRIKHNEANRLSDGYVPIVIPRK